MLIQIEIKSCQDCIYLGHSGAFTKGGAKSICTHDAAAKTFTVDKSINKKDPTDIYHWRHRIINDLNKEPPQKCPLRHGHQY